MSIVTLPPYSIQRVVTPLSETIDWSIEFTGISEVWKKTKGKGIKIGVADTGIDFDHPDLAAAIARYKDFSGSRYGARDRAGHGTHVAGTIAAQHNELGIRGVAPDSRLWIAKVLGDNGSGSSQSVASGISWLASEGVDIITMSLGSPQPSGDIVRAIEAAVAAGIFVICAAGNTGRPNDVNYPARWRGLQNPNRDTIAVAAHDKNGKIASFSSRGDEIDISGPGVDILSCYPGGGLAKMSGTCIAKGSYVYGPEGPKTIENVAPGETVYGFQDGKIVERVVYDQQMKGTNDVMQLRAAGRDVKLTPTHRVLCVDTKSRDVDWVEAQNLVKGRHRLLLPRALPSRVNPYLDNTISKNFAWLLGFYAGDGWVSSTKRGDRVHFANATDKPELMAEVEKKWRETTGKALKYNKAGTWCYDDSTKLATVIDALGLNDYAQQKTIPLWLWSLSRDKQLEFWNGYRKADGHLHRWDSSRPGLEAFECTSPDLIRRLTAFADYHGWQHSTVASRTRKLKAPNSPNALYSTAYNMRTSRKAPAGGWSALKTGKSDNQNGLAAARDMGLDVANLFCADFRIDEPQEVTEVFDLSVPGADCFITQGLITHNSMATPFVTGAVALALATHREAKDVKTPLKTMTQLREHLQKAAIDIGAPGHDADAGFGLIKPIDLLNESAHENAPEPGEDTSWLLFGLEIMARLAGRTVNKPATGGERIGIN